MMQRTVIHYTDPSHGWYKVPFTELEALGIVDKITPWSGIHQSGYAYLEEDQDATTYFEARAVSAAGEPKVKTRYSNRSRVRNYAPYDPDYVRLWLNWKAAGKRVKS